MLPHESVADSQTKDAIFKALSAYAIILSGEIELIADEQTVTLRSGDVVVLRATRHAWANRSNNVARVAFVMMGVQPLGIEEGLVKPLTQPK